MVKIQKMYYVLESVSFFRDNPQPSSLHPLYQDMEKVQRLNGSGLEKPDTFQ